MTDLDTPYSLTEKGKLCLAQNDLTQAIYYFESAANQKSFGGYYHLIDWYINHKEPQNALNYCLELYARAPFDNRTRVINLIEKIVAEYRDNDTFTTCAINRLQKYDIRLKCLNSTLTPNETISLYTIALQNGEKSVIEPLEKMRDVDGLNYYVIAKAYEFGWAIPKNLRKATDYYYKALLNGQKSAIEDLLRLAEQNVVPASGKLVDYYVMQADYQRAAQYFLNIAKKCKKIAISKESDSSSKFLFDFYQPTYQQKPYQCKTKEPIDYSTLESGEEREIVYHFLEAQTPPGFNHYLLTLMYIDGILVEHNDYQAINELKKAVQLKTLVVDSKLKNLIESLDPSVYLLLAQTQLRNNNVGKCIEYCIIAQELNVNGASTVLSDAKKFCESTNNGISISELNRIEKSVSDYITGKKYEQNEDLVSALCLYIESSEYGYKQAQEQVNKIQGSKTWRDYLIEYLTDKQAYLIHMTDINHLKGILQTGLLGSRNDFVEYAQDNADADVIKHTRECVKKNTRFYFKPGTPTLYRFINDNPYSTFVILKFQWKIIDDYDGYVFNGNAASIYSDQMPIEHYFGSPSLFMEWPIILDRNSHIPGDKELTRKRNAELDISAPVSLRYLDQIIFKTEEDLQTFSQDNPSLINNYKTCINNDCFGDVVDLDKLLLKFMPKPYYPDLFEKK